LGAEKGGKTALSVSHTHTRMRIGNLIADTAHPAIQSHRSHESIRKRPSDRFAARARVFLFLFRSLARTSSRPHLLGDVVVVGHRLLHRDAVGLEDALAVGVVELLEVGIAGALRGWREGGKRGSEKSIFLLSEQAERRKNQSAPLSLREKNRVQDVALTSRNVSKCSPCSAVYDTICACFCLLSERRGREIAAGRRIARGNFFLLFFGFL
jgi:hypothetical protein